MISFERLNLSRIPWEELDRFADRTVMQTLPWLHFVAKTQNGEPVVAAIKENGHTVGYFTGLIIRKLGFKILGSPFKGWTTSYMGFNLIQGMSRHEALNALPRFAFRDLGCHYLEIMDRHITELDYHDLSYTAQRTRSFEIDLNLSENLLLANMESSCRWSIRKAAKSGVVIEEASGLDFADDYFAQLQDVFAKQSLVPTYNAERVRELIKHLLPTGNLLLLRARNSGGECIATGIFPAFNDTMYFWGGASWRQHQTLRPNEALMWYAMKYWKARHISKLDMVGGGKYKKKYGGSGIEVPRLIKSKIDALIHLRNLAESAWGLRNRILGGIKRV